MLKPHAAQSCRSRVLAAFVLASNVTKSSNSSGQAGVSSSGVYPISYSWLSGSAEGRKNRITKRKPAPPNEGQLWETRQQKDKNFLLHPLVPSAFGKDACLQAPHLQEGGKATRAAAPGRGPTRPFAAPMGLAPRFVPTPPWSPLLFLVSSLSLFPASPSSSPRRL